MLGNILILAVADLPNHTFKYNTPVKYTSLYVEVMLTIMFLSLEIFSGFGNIIVGSEVVGFDMRFCPSN